jgi:hypothetical protein
VVITNTNNSVNGNKTATATSRAAAVTVNSLTDAQTPNITAEPQDVTVNIGATASLTVSASVTDGGTLTYQWYGNTANSNSGGEIINGASDANYTPSTATAGTLYYYVVVTNTNNSVNGNKTVTATSRAASVTVQSVTSAEDNFFIDLKIYPNPFTDAIRITGAVETDNYPSLRVTNVAGVIVHTQQITSPDETIRLEHLSAGTYFFTIEQDGKMKTVKVIRN